MTAADVVERGPRVLRMERKALTAPAYPPALREHVKRFGVRPVAITGASGAATVRDAVVCIAEQRGLAEDAEYARRGAGVMTDGDLTRRLGARRAIMPVPGVDVRTRTPNLASRDEAASAVVYRMGTHGILSMPVVMPTGPSAWFTCGI